MKVVYKAWTIWGRISKYLSKELHYPGLPFRNLRLVNLCRTISTNRYYLAVTDRDCNGMPEGYWVIEEQCECGKAHTSYIDNRNS